MNFCWFGNLECFNFAYSESSFLSAKPVGAGIALGRACFCDDGDVFASAAKLVAGFGLRVGLWSTVFEAIAYGRFPPPNIF